jgi:CheY-like chemotaxis protein
LGLAIVKCLVEAHGGTVALESALDVGSTFSFTLPVYSEDAEVDVFLADNLAVTAAMGSCLAIIKIAVDRANSTGDAPVEDRRNLTRMAEALERTVRREDDAVLMCPSRGILLVVGEVSDGGESAYRNRIEATLARYQTECALIELSSCVADGHETPAQIRAKLSRSLAPVESRRGSPRVLVIDDSFQFCRFVLTGLLSAGLGLDVRMATDGLAGCLEFGQFSPDLVILDVAMPELDGAQVLSRLRGHPHNPEARFMVISSTVGRFKELEELGADICLSKPVSMRVLLAATRSLLGLTIPVISESDHDTAAELNETEEREPTCHTGR